MGTGKDARDRRVVYDYSFKRSQHDDRAIKKVIERVEAVAAGIRPLKKDRFVTIADATKSLNWSVVEQAGYLAGLKGYVTNIDTDTMDGPGVVAAYHDLYPVERSFRMTKSDLAARPITTESGTASKLTGPSCSPLSQSRVKHKPELRSASRRSSRRCDRSDPQPSASANNSSPPRPASPTPPGHSDLSDLAQDSPRVVTKPALHNPRCSRGLNPPVSSRDLAM